MISEFQGAYRFLSNFYPVLGHLTTEHLYQAAKAKHEKDANYILSLPSPGTAKQAGRRVPIRDDWELTKLDVMLGALQWKFSFPELAVRLVETGNEWLQEGNNWHDNFWGVCLGNCRRPHPGITTGQNHLGRLLMQVRSELRG